MEFVLSLRSFFLEFRKEREFCSLLFVWLSGSWMKERRKALFFCSYSVGGGSDFLSSFGFHLLVVEFMKTRFEIREQIGHNIDLRMSDAKTVPIRFATS